MSIEDEFWHSRWRDGNTPWQQARPNARLRAHFPRLGTQGGDEVLVPLCGKALDMHWLLERRVRVLGVELSASAARGFFDDHGLRFLERREGAFTVFEGDAIRILCGDVFALEPVHLARVRAVYDRAALVALDAGDRARYGAMLCDHLPPATHQLVVTFEYDVRQMSGPPFSVAAVDLCTLYGNRYGVQALESVSVIDEEPHFRTRGLDALTEHAFLLHDQRD